MVPLAIFGAAEVAAGGVLELALAAEESSLTVTQAMNLATHVADGFLADAMGASRESRYPCWPGRRCRRSDGG